ncbi:fimbrial biogenesis chaperone [Dryocola clanedunensis]
MNKTMEWLASFPVMILMALSIGCVSQAQASVALGATRVIYPADQKQVKLPVTNNDEMSTFLIQSWIENADDKKDGRFLITPPLVAMKGKKENTLRIVNVSNKQLPQDRESLFWINVKAIPGMDKASENKNTLQLAIISRIKLLYRPVNLSLPPDQAAEKLRFKRAAGQLSLINPTPYFLTVTELYVGNTELEGTLVPPMGEITVTLPANAGRDISYKTINDYGALTPKLKAIMQ